MDTTETYRKMMSGAWADLKDDMPIGGLLFSRRLRMLYMLDGEVVMWRENVNTSNCERAIPLLEQDQLQKMLGYPLWRLNWDFASWLFDIDNEGQCDFHVRHEHLEFISMEQLWLAFYMDQEHNKVWSEDKWTKKE